MAALDRYRKPIEDARKQKNSNVPPEIIAEQRFSKWLGSLPRLFVLGILRFSVAIAILSIFVLYLNKQGLL